MTDGAVVWHKRLTTQVLFFLTLALVPLGVIGVMQNQRLSAEVEKRSELSLMALTERAASGERQLIQRAFGAAETLSGLADDVFDDIDACRRNVQRFLRSNEKFAFVGFIDRDGISECSSVDAVLDFSGYPNFPELVANPRPNVEVNLQAPGSGQSVMIINQPHFQNDRLEGYISVSLPLNEVGQTDDFMGDANPITLVTFNAAGDLLSTESGRERAMRLLPRDIALTNLAQGEARTLVAVGEDGQDYVYSIVPIVPDVVYALGSWRLDRLAGTSATSAFFDAVLPFLMWFASLFVVWFVVDRLVIDRVHQLSGAMQRFSRDRSLPEVTKSKKTTSELGKLETALYSMAEDILQDEAAQEDRLREKSVLLKEVHHRVKNNLQIISSIMNMQIRKAQAVETKHALGQVQDRIMGLSGVHRTLYQADSLSRVDAASLIKQIVEQSRAIGSRADTAVKVDLALDPVTVFPDQAVPLSMLVSEALTNAMKYIGGDTPGISVSLSLADDDHAHLVIRNTRAPAPSQDEETKTLSTGLGQQLIRAFTTQLGGQSDVTQSDDFYQLSVTFQVEAFKEEPQDY